MSSPRSFAAHAAVAALLAAPAVGAQQPRALDLQPSAPVASFARWGCGGSPPAS